MDELNSRDSLGFDDSSVAIVGLLHDVCKVNQYVPNILKTGRSAAEPWKIEDSIPLGHGEKSVYLLARLGFDLTDEEAVAIRYHMGPYDEIGVWKINGRMNKLAELCFTADNYCAKLLE